MDYSDAIEIDARPELVFATLSNLAEMGRLSPENTGGEWLGSASGPALGARFKGTNARDSDTWSTTARISTFEPPSTFVFDVTFGPFRVSKWEYSVEPTPNGCRVIESWTERRNVFVRRSDKKSEFNRAEYTKTSIRITLERLKEVCESSSSGTA